MKTFTIYVTLQEELTVDQIWPDGDAPEDPTPEDVREVMLGCGDLGRTLDDWNLLSDLDLSVTET